MTVALANYPAGATLGGTLTVTASGGVATFSGLTLTTAGSGYTLVATSSGLGERVTNAITVTPAAASQLVIQTQPSATATAGQAFTTQPVVEETDQYGNVETSRQHHGGHGRACSSGTGPLQGTTTATVSGGIATFTNLADNTAETITLKFTGGSLTPATSRTIVVSPAAASQLVIHTQPSGDGHRRAGVRHRACHLRRRPVRQPGDGRQQHSGHRGTPERHSPAFGATATTSGRRGHLHEPDRRSRPRPLRSASPAAAWPRRPNNIVVVSPAAASQLVVQTQPSATCDGGAAVCHATGHRRRGSRTVTWRRATTARF